MPEHFYKRRWKWMKSLIKGYEATCKQDSYNKMIKLLKAKQKFLTCSSGSPRLNQIGATDATKRLSRLPPNANFFEIIKGPIHHSY